MPSEVGAEIFLQIVCYFVGRTLLPIMSFGESTPNLGRGRDGSGFDGMASIAGRMARLSSQTI